MSKMKVNRKNNQIIVKTKLGKTEVINQQELAIFNTKLIRGLMRPMVLGEKKVNYVAPDGILLEKYLKRGINKNDFFLVFAQLNEAIKKIERYGFSINNLVLDFKYIFVNERTREINFIYQPIMGICSNVSIFTFLYEMISKAVFQVSEDMRVVNELTNFLNRMQFFSTLEVEKCILQIYPEIYQQVHRDSFGQSTQLHRNMPATIEDEETGRMSQAELDDLVNEETGLLIEENDEWEEQTTLLNDVSQETTVLKQQIYPYLIRKSTKEKVQIAKPVFRIGKERSYVDYVIADNNAISRLHADIITKEEGYYIRDNNSTNHTYINGGVIPTNQEIEIKDGSEIVFANESFEFYVG